MKIQAVTIEKMTAGNFGVYIYTLQGGFWEWGGKCLGDKIINSIQEAKELIGDHFFLGAFDRTLPTRLPYEHYKVLDDN